MKDLNTSTKEFQGFKRALGHFISEACENFSHGSIPRMAWKRIIRAENTAQLKLEDRPNYSDLVFPFFRSLHYKPTNSFKKVINIVEKTPKLAKVLLVDGIGNHIDDKTFREWEVTNKLAGSFLSLYFTYAKSPTFSEQVYNEVFDIFISDITSERVTVKILNPLLNARLTNCEQMCIAPHLIIRNISDFELEDWINSFVDQHQFSLIGGLRVDRLNCAIETTWEQGRYEPQENQVCTDAISNLLTTLRVVTDRNVNIAFTKPSSSSILQKGLDSTSNIKSHLTDIDIVADIDVSLKQDITNIWTRITSLSNKNRIQLALKRWNTVSHRSDEKDKLIDYWIALEALFSESSQEVRYRASLRIAALTGDTPEERRQIYDDMKDSYDLRSAIVHGDVFQKGKKNKKDNHILISRTRYCLRKTLLKLLLSEKTIDPMSIELELLDKYKEKIVPSEKS